MPADGRRNNRRAAGIFAIGGSKKQNAAHAHEENMHSIAVRAAENATIDERAASLSADERALN